MEHNRTEIIKDKNSSKAQGFLRKLSGGSEALYDLSGSRVGTYNAQRDKTLDNSGNVIARKNRWLSLLPPE
jgi:hypothetical protein